MIRHQLKKNESWPREKWREKFFFYIVTKVQDQSHGDLLSSTTCLDHWVVLRCSHTRFFQMFEWSRDHLGPLGSKSGSAPAYAPGLKAYLIRVYKLDQFFMHLKLWHYYSTQIITHNFYFLFFLLIPTL